ncbi:MAG: hypothetical protein WC935_05150 [Thermoleophilia bacterium]
MHLSVRMNKTRTLLLVALTIGAAVPARAGGILPGVDIAAAFGGQLLSMEANRVKVEIGGVVMTVTVETGSVLAENRATVPALITWGFNTLRVQLPVVAAGLDIKSAVLLANGHPVGKWLPQGRCWIIDAKELAAVYRIMAVEMASAGANFDRLVLPPIDFEAVFVIRNGERREYRVLLVFRAVTHRDVTESAGFTLLCQNTARWDPCGDRDFHRPEDEMRAELEDWYEEEVTGFVPSGLDPARVARARRRSQQVRDGAMSRIRVRYEEADGSLARYVIPKGTCLYWFIPEELVLSDTQLAVTPQGVPGQRYTLLPKGSEPSIPSHWSPAIRAALVGLRCVVITRTVYTGAEVNFEVPHGIIGLAPAIQRKALGPDGPQVVTIANFLVLGTSQAGANGDPLIWRYVDGGDLLSFGLPRPTELVVRMCSMSPGEREAEERRRSATPPAQPAPTVPVPAPVSPTSGVPTIGAP